VSPTVSIILPTFDRAKFLPEALAAIAGQQWTDWELIVVDDGSTDNTRELVPELTRGWPQPVRYIHQENQGAYGARNTGLDHATGKYIAFYDSDDLWLPHHLQDCVQALEANPDVDWVFGACQLVNHTTGCEIAANSFYKSGEPRPFRRLATQVRGKLHVISDLNSAPVILSTGLFAGLQNSVVARHVFQHRRFNREFRHENEDALFVAALVLGGTTFAYFDRIHVTYRVHDAQSSASGPQSSDSLKRKLSAIHSACLAFDRDNVMPPRTRRAFRKAVSQSMFWSLGYSVHAVNGDFRSAIRVYAKALAIYPWQPRCWKSFTTSLLRSVFQPTRGHNT
jgi:GT2 family glycosyltransferase